MDCSEKCSFIDRGCRINLSGNSRKISVSKDTVPRSKRQGPANKNIWTNGKWDQDYSTLWPGNMHKMIFNDMSLHMAGAPEIWIDQSGFLMRENCTVLTSLWAYRKGTEIWQLYSLEMALNLCKKEFLVPKTLSDYKKWKTWNILCLQASHWVPQMGRLFRLGRI